MTNLSPSEQADFERRCVRQRDIARTSPCFHPGQEPKELYQLRLGPWTIVFSLDRYMHPAVWHGIVMLLKETGTERIVDRNGVYIFDAPEERLLPIQLWNHEERDIAKDLLAAAFGPIIRADTRVRVMETIFGLHWTVKADV